MTRFFSAPTLILIAIAGLSACGTSPTPRLQSAHEAYKKAESDPKITDNAPLDLHEAKKALAQADKAESAADMDHYAEQAEKHLKIAEVNAERKLAEGETKKLSDEKIKVVLESREKEALRAKMEAEAKAQEAVKAKQDADKAKQDADAARAQAEQALAQIKALEAQLAELQAKQTDRGLVLTLGDVLFETGKAELLGSAMQNIGKVAEFLTKNPNRNVLVEGHTDNVGSESYNLELSERRAESVRLALIQRGVAAERIQSRGYGKALPVASNDSPTGRQQNRRVEIVIGNEGQAVAPR